MHWYKRNRNLIGIYSLIFLCFISATLLGNRAVTVFSETESSRSTIVIDAGHGGVDGGAISCSGVYESHINLQIAQKVNDMLHLLGFDTVMIRDTDRSVYTEGNTIAAKKVSDIRERVRIANTTPRALYISIHQNHFSDSRYWGNQVFYNKNIESKILAASMQESLHKNLTPDNKRTCKQSKGVYLMEHINCPGILIECGFLSNPAEEQKLRNNEYQTQLSAIIATTMAQYLNT